MARWTSAIAVVRYIQFFLLIWTFSCIDPADHHCSTYNDHGLKPAGVFSDTHQNGRGSSVMTGVLFTSAESSLPKRAQSAFDSWSIDDEDDLDDSIANSYSTESDADVELQSSTPSVDRTSRGIPLVRPATALVDEYEPEEDSYEDDGLASDDFVVVPAMPPEASLDAYPDSELVFEPPFLQFKDQPIAIAATGDFQIFNGLSEDMKILSLVSESNQFHPVGGVGEVVKSKSSITLQVIYLPYHLEPSSTIITISTSRGDFKYKVQGEATQNPYQLLPLLGIKQAHNTKNFDLPIRIYNPHDEPLRIKEIYTTEAYLTLKGVPLDNDSNQQDGLLSKSGDREASSGDYSTTRSNHSSDEQADKMNHHYVISDRVTGKVLYNSSTSNESLQNDGYAAMQKITGEVNGRFRPEISWEVPPRTEVHLVTLSIAMNLPVDSYQGYLHVKTERNNVVVPVEFEILPSTVFAVPSVIDFGLLTNAGERRTVDLWLANTGAENLLVTDVALSNVDSNFHLTLFKNPVIHAGKRVHSRVATMHYHASKPGKMSGLLLLTTNQTISSDGSKMVVEIPYMATVLHGGIGFDHTKTRFVLPIFNLSYPNSCQHCDNNPAVLRSVNGKDDVITSVEDTHLRTVQRNMSFTNYFNVPVMLQSIVFDNCKNLFNVSFDTGARSVVGALEEWSPITLNFQEEFAMGLAAKREDYLPKTCDMDIYTNVSSHKIQIHVLNGKINIEYLDSPMLEHLSELPPAFAPKWGPGTADPALLPSIMPTAVPRPLARNEMTSEEKYYDRDYDDEGVIKMGTDLEVCEEASCYPVNTDIYHIDLGAISLTNPRPLAVVFSNYNPLEVQMTMTHSSYDLCACLEGIWQTSDEDSEANAYRLLPNSIKISYEEALQIPHRCFCAGSNNTNRVDSQAKGFGVHHGLPSRNMVTAANALITRTDQLTYSNNKFTTNVRNVQSYDNNSIKEESGDDEPVTYTSKPQTNTFFTLSFKNLSDCFIVPVRLQGYQQNRTNECRSKEYLPNLIDADLEQTRRLHPNEKGSIAVDFKTEYQQMRLYLHFVAIEGSLTTKVAEQDESLGGNFIMGFRTPLTMETTSSISESLVDLTVGVRPTEYTINTYPAEDISNDFVSSHANRSQLNNIEDTHPQKWISHILPSATCSDPFIFAQPGNRALLMNRMVPSRMSYRSFLNITSLWSCTYNLLVRRNFSSSHKSLMQKLKYLDTAKLEDGDPKSLYGNMLELKNEWMRHFPFGMPLAEANVTIQAKQVLHHFEIRNASVHIPVAYAADSYEIQLPTVEINHVQWFYLEVRNPYVMPLQFSIVEDTAFVGEVLQRRQIAAQSLLKSGMITHSLEDNSVSDSVRAEYRAETIDAYVTAISSRDRSYARHFCNAHDPEKKDGRSDCSEEFWERMSPEVVDNSELLRSELSIADGALTYMANKEISKTLRPSLVAAGKAMNTKAPVSVPGTAVSDGDDLPSSLRTSSIWRAQSSFPFILTARGTAKWVVQPQSTTQIGPFFYSPEFTDQQDDSFGSFYLFNNFTGVNRVDIHANTGMAQLLVRNLTKECGTKFKQQGDGKGLVEPRITFNAMEKLWTVGPVIADTFGESYKIMLKNIGKVPATVHDVMTDDQSCMKRSLFYPLFDRIRYFLGFSLTSTMPEHCDSLPAIVRTAEEFAIVIHGPTSCSSGTYHHHVTLGLDDVALAKQAPAKRWLVGNFFGTNRIHSNDANVHVDVLINMSEALLDKCASAPFDQQTPLHGYIFLFACTFLLIVVIHLLWFSLEASLQQRKVKRARRALQQRVSDRGGALLFCSSSIGVSMRDILDNASFQVNASNESLSKITTESDSGRNYPPKFPKNKRTGRESKAESTLDNVSISKERSHTHSEAALKATPRSALITHGYDLRDVLHNFGRPQVSSEASPYVERTRSNSDVERTLDVTSTNDLVYSCFRNPLKAVEKVRAAKESEDGTRDINIAISDANKAAELPESLNEPAIQEQFGGTEYNTVTMSTQMETQPPVVCPEDQQDGAAVEYKMSNQEALKKSRRRKDRKSGKTSDTNKFNTVKTVAATEDTERSGDASLQLIGTQPDVVKPLNLEYPSDVNKCSAQFDPSTLMQREESGTTSSITELGMDSQMTSRSLDLEEADDESELKVDVERNKLEQMHDEIAYATQEVHSVSPLPLKEGNSVNADSPLFRYTGQLLDGRSSGSLQISSPSAVERSESTSYILGQALAGNTAFQDPSYVQSNPSTIPLLPADDAPLTDRLADLLRPDDYGGLFNLPPASDVSSVGLDMSLLMDSLRTNTVTLEGEEHDGPDAPALAVVENLLDPLTNIGDVTLAPSATSIDATNDYLNELGALSALDQEVSSRGRYQPYDVNTSSRGSAIDREAMTSVPSHDQYLDDITGLMLGSGLRATAPEFTAKNRNELYVHASVDGDAHMTGSLPLRAGPPPGFEHMPAGGVMQERKAIPMAQLQHAPDDLKDSTDQLAHANRYNSPPQHIDAFQDTHAKAFIPHGPQYQVHQMQQASEVGAAKYYQNRSPAEPMVPMPAEVAPKHQGIVAQNELLHPASGNGHRFGRSFSEDADPSTREWLTNITMRVSADDDEDLDAIFGSESRDIVSTINRSLLDDDEQNWQHRRTNELHNRDQLVHQQQLMQQQQRQQYQQVQNPYSYTGSVPINQQGWRERHDSERRMVEQQYLQENDFNRLPVQPQYAPADQNVNSEKRQRGGRRGGRYDRRNKR